MASDTTTQIVTAPNGAVLVLLETAEKLFAERGIDAVSTREIARSAGQKNHSAVAYHFGDKDQLITAILQWRLPLLNERRKQLLTFIKENGQTRNLRAIIGALVIPFVEVLRDDTEHNHYIGFIGQLSARRHNELNQRAEAHLTSATQVLSRLLREALAELPAEIFSARAELMAAQLYQGLALWDARRRDHDPDYDNASLGWRSENLIDVISAGLASPLSGPTRRQLKQRRD